MMAQVSLPHVITQEGQSTRWEMEILSGDPVLPVCSRLSSTSRPSPAETLGRGSVWPEHMAEPAELRLRKARAFPSRSAMGMTAGILHLCHE